MTEEQRLKSVLNEIKWRVGAYVPNKFTAADREVCDMLGVKTG